MTDKRPNILLVDDEKDVLSFMEAALQTIGANCILCEDGNKALALIEENKKDYFQLVILDCLLPKMHGFDVLKAIKTNKRTYHIPVIMISGIYKKRNYREDLIDNKKANAFLAKPFTAADLLNAVEPFISEQLNLTGEEDFSGYQETFDELPDMEPFEPPPAEHAPEASPEERAVPSRGSLSDIPFSEIIRVLYLSGKTATLKLAREGEKKIILLKDGRFVWAMSNMIMHTLEHMMFSEGSLSLEQYYYFSKKAFGKQKEHINCQDILSTVSEGEKKALLRKQMQMIITDTFEWYEGHYIVENSLMKLSSMEDIMLSTYEIVKEGVLAINNWEILKKFFQSLQIRFKYGRNQDTAQLRLAFSPEELAVLKLMDNSTTLTGILKASPRPDFETLKLLYAFCILGVINPVNDNSFTTLSFENKPEETLKPPPREPEPESALDDETETTYRVIRHSTTQETARVNVSSTEVQTLKHNKPKSPIGEFYQSIINEKNPLKIIGVTPGDSRDTIKHRYASLVKTYHPDRYHNKVDTETYNQLVAATDLVNKAYKAVMERYDELAHQKQVDFQDFKAEDEPAQKSPQDDARLRQQKEQISKNLFIKGRNALIKKDYQTAFSSFRYLNSLEGENPEYIGYYGISAYYVNQKTLAFDLLSKIADSNTNNPDLYYFIGKVYAERNQKTKAREFFNKALTFDPLHEPSQNALDSLDSPDKGSKDGSFIKKLFKK